MGKVALKFFSLAGFFLRFHLSDGNTTCLCKHYDCLFWILKIQVSFCTARPGLADKKNPFPVRAGANIKKNA